MIDPRALRQTLEEYYHNLPHPDVPSIRVRDYEAFARVAARFNSNPKPDPDQIAHAHEMLKGIEMAPAEFERVWDLAKPLANHLLNRAPTAHDLQMLNGAHPGDIHGYFRDHPHPNVPSVSAGDLADMHHIAAPIAIEHAKRWPTERELATFHAGNYSGEDIANHFKSEKRNA